jgi:protein-S-isoprenylcysteine O-methyltransferase Ste14
MDTATFDIYDIIIWTGAAISALGLLGLIWCIISVSRAKRAKLDDEAMRAVLKSALPLNLGALFLSVIGLMMVIVGIFLS